MGKTILAFLFGFAYATGTYFTFVTMHEAGVALFIICSIAMFSTVAYIILYYWED